MSGGKEREIFEKQEYDKDGENQLYCLKHALNNLFNQQPDWLEVGEFIEASEHLNKENNNREIRERNWGTDEAFRLVNHKDFRLFDDADIGDILRLMELPHDLYLKTKQEVSTFLDKMFRELREKYMGQHNIRKFIKGFVVNQDGNHWVCYRLKYDNFPYKNYVYKDSMKAKTFVIDEKNLKRVFLEIAMKNKNLPEGTPFMNIIGLFEYDRANGTEQNRRVANLFPMQTFKNIKKSNSSSQCLLCEYLGHKTYHTEYESHRHNSTCISAFQQFLQSENN